MAEFKLAPPGMTERDVPQIVQALGTLVQLGAKPSEIADFLLDVHGKRSRERAEGKFGM